MMPLLPLAVSFFLANLPSMLGDPFRSGPRFLGHHPAPWA